MNLKLIPSIAASALLVLAPAATGQRLPGKNDNARFGDPTSTARAYEDTLYGVVKKIDKAEIVLEKTQFGLDQTIKLEAKTKFIRDGKASSLEAVKVGEGVFVQTKKVKKTGEWVAKKVMMGAMTPKSP